ncbi:TPA: SEC10/PgrA surface exclusion domain-containing protein [Streptococcus suis]|nr:SEC10/PgrA surface exclusion domain-containing protein [Streptococcus suis]HEM4052572.1 SEC10/PgrA surface exclusion domain-containing protein [Streptococcus suis]HEM6393105.1 SEC10/PgrA surface exclusion domain-containing protein [Streptococcus suis]HEM6435594.1 SEC10/PgrA surface exclusion domain-containing protein [Streptococcus suis]
MKKNKYIYGTIAATTAITIATVGTPAFAEEVTPTVETNTDTVVSTTETPVAEAPKTSADVKPALDAQQAVVDATAAEASQAQADADAANQAVTTAEAEVATATEAVKDAEENLANATPENIAANQADQAANLADQTANATETDEVNAEIASQTQTVADAQVAVDTAQAEKDQADSDVTAAEADVKSAQDALSGTGLSEAQANLDTASKAVTDAKANVDTATQAVEDAKKADADRDAKIKAAETDVAVKTDAVETASNRVTTAQSKVATTTDTLAKANDAVTKAQDEIQQATASQDDKTKFATAVLAEINDKTGALYFKDETAALTAHMAEFNRLREEKKDLEAQNYAEEHLLSQMLKLYTDEQSQELVKQLVGSTAFNKTYKLQNGKLVLSKEDYTALNIAFASQLNAFRKISGLDAINQVTEESIEQGLKAMEVWNEHANLPENISKTGLELKHSGFNKVTTATNAFTENIYPTGGFKKTELTFTELNTMFAYTMLGFAFKDAHANWGHYNNLLQGQNVMMGLYQNNSGNGAGGAYFTHSYTIPTTARIVYSQYSQNNSDYWSKALNTVTKEINDYKELLKNDDAYRELIVNASVFNNRLYSRYLDGEKISNEEYAERDKLFQLVIDYEDDNNIKFPTAYEYAKNIAPFRVGLYELDPQYIDRNVDLAFESTLKYINNNASSYHDANTDFMKKLVSDNKLGELQAVLIQAQADQAAAQTASDNAKAELTKASTDYATALAAKTAAEKTLADATATPLQTQVAENNLRLATIALQNAETRKVEAQKAVDNFSGSLSEKKAALDTAKANLATAQATATAKAEALTTAQANLATQQATLDSLNKERDALLAEKDRLVEEAKALAEELDGYMNAPARLEKAKATLAEKQAALTEAQAKAETAQEKLETVTAKLAEEKAKLAELQAEYNKLKDLEDKAKDNVIATLPDGTIVAVPKDAPTAAEKPAINIDAVKDAITKGQDVTVVDGKVVVANPQAGVTVTPQGITDRAKALPNTGEQTSLLALAGVAVLSSLGLASARRRKQG